MKDADKFLFGIVVAVVALVVVAFAVALRQPEPSYRSPEDTPEAVVQNYLLAVRQEDNERAYGYLSPTLSGHPASVEVFVDDVTRDSWGYRLNSDATALEVESSTVTGTRAVVTVKETEFVSNGLFDSYQSSHVFRMRLALEGGTWRLVGGEQYWSFCWERRDEYCRGRGLITIPPEPASAEPAVEATTPADAPAAADATTAPGATP